MVAPARTATVLLTLDRTSPVPLHHQVSEQLTAAIAQGMVKPGEKLEREDRLAERLNISRPTLRQALNDLAERGLIVRVRGVGTMVAQPAEVALRAAGRFRPAATHGRQWTHLLRLDPDHQNPSVAREFGLGERARLIYLEQLLVLDSRSVSLHRTWLPTTIFNPALQDLAATPPRRVLSEAGHPVASERRTFGRRPADAVEQAALGVLASDLVFTVCALSFDSRGEPVERTATTYRRERDQYEALLAAG